MKAWKAVHVLSGSIIEALLTDYLKSIDHKDIIIKDPCEMTLGPLISACRSVGLLTEKAEQLSRAVQSYRNLIHPGRQIRLEEDVNEESSIVALALVDIVIKEVIKKRKEVYGYTANQLITKLLKDESSKPIIRHLVKELNKDEIERLLLTIIPQKYFELCDLPAKIYYNSIPMLVKCFREAFEIADDQVKEKVAKRFVKILKEENSEYVLFYESEFFRCADIMYIDESERNIVVEHLLSNLDSFIEEGKIIKLKGISKYLQKNNIGDFVDPFIQNIINVNKANYLDEIKTFLLQEYKSLSNQLGEIFIARLEQWVTHLDERGKSEKANRVIELKYSLPSDDELPF